MSVVADKEPILNGAYIKEGSKPEDWSMKAIWEGMYGAVEDSLPRQTGMIASGDRFLSVKEAIDSTMFPIAMGQLIIRKVIAGYEMDGFIGDRLVDRVPSNIPTEKIPGFTAAQAGDIVNQGEPYQEKSFGEKFVTTATDKRGSIISITEEDIKFTWEE